MSSKYWKPLARLDAAGLLEAMGGLFHPVGMYLHNGQQYRRITFGSCLGQMYHLLGGGTAPSHTAIRQGLDVKRKEEASLYIVVMVHPDPARRGFVEDLLPEYLRPYWTTLEQTNDERYDLSVIEVHPDLKPVEVGLLYQTLRTSWEYQDIMGQAKAWWSPVIKRLFWATAVAQGAHSPWVSHSSAARLLIAAHGLGAVTDFYKNDPLYKYAEQSSSWDWFWGDGFGPFDWSIGENVTARMGETVPTPGFVAGRGGFNLSRNGVGVYISFVEREVTEEHPHYKELKLLYDELKRYL